MILYRPRADFQTNNINLLHEAADGNLIYKFIEILNLYCVRYIRIRQEALRKLSRGKVDTKVKQILAHFGRCALSATTVKQTLAKFR